jgi:PPE-repeat protein
VIDYGLLPPEINSARMYAGPGPGSMLAAAVAWDGLAVELSSAASSYQSVVSGLSGGPWLGPTSVSMAAAAAPYVGWMHATAASTAQTAGQARLAAAAFEAAFVATVPPPVVAANRAQLMALVATNFVGQNTPAIMATEAHYAQMWAQDAAAMFGYAGSSALASRVTPWTVPAQNTNLGGLAAQHAALAHATLSAASIQQTTLPQPLTAVPQTLQSLASPAASTTPSQVSGLVSGSGSSSSLSSQLSSMLTDASEASSLSEPAVFGMMLPTQMMGTFSQMARMGAAAPALGGVAMRPSSLMMHGPGGLGSGMNPAASAGMGQAKMLGALSVPPSWAAATPLNPAAGLPGAGGGVLPQAAGGPASMYGGVPMGASTGRGPGLLGVNDVLKLPPRHFVIPRPFAAG